MSRKPYRTQTAVNCYRSEPAGFRGWGSQETCPRQVGVVFAIPVYQVSNPHLNHSIRT